MNRTEIAQLLAYLASIDATLTAMAAGTPVTGTVSINGITGALSGLTGSLPISGLGALGAIPVSGIADAVTITGAVDATLVAPLGTGTVASAIRVNVVV